jgi:hypothetical protein
VGSFLGEGGGVAMNKRGLIYIVIVSLFVIIFLAVFLTYNTYEYRDKQDILEVRIRTMDNFINDFHQDVHRATYISSFRAMIALEEYIARNAVFFNNTETAFKEVFYNGTINGDYANIMENASFKEYESRLDGIANDIGISFSVNVTGVEMYQEDPWNITVIVNATINLSDNRRLAYWLYNKSFLTHVPIFDLRDPIYSVYTNGLVPNTIRVFNTTNYVDDTGDANDTTSLQLFVNNSYYAHNPLSPSFLQRFENDTSASACCGIESFVNKQAISDQGITIDVDRNAVDFIYFNNLSTTNICNVQNMPSWFVVDVDRNETYEIDELDYSTSC